MRIPVLIPASLETGEGARVTHGTWLCGQMASRDVRSDVLFKRMNLLGYPAQSPGIVSLWRHDRCRISLVCLPTLLSALGMSESEQCAWIFLFTTATFPSLAPFLKAAA